MHWREVVEALVSAPWIETTGSAVQGAVRGVYQAMGPAGQSVQNFLHGVWLGHPLHAVVTDVPVGAWTATLTLDALEALGHEELAWGADASLKLGLVSALTAATAGLTDWYPLHGVRHRVGTVHMLCNVSATAFYTTSLLLRQNGQRGAGRWAALAGFTAMTAGAYLGGYLVYDQQVGVEHLPEAEPEAFAPVLAEAELGEGQMRRVDVGDTPVLLVRRNGVIYAMSDMCTHLGCSLAQGELIEDSVRCMCHASRFALADGRVIDGPSTYWQPVYRVRAREGQIEVGEPMD
jgi:nitrite reductase/ring-hydroxylating ferredoxin subunit/uncharacterized membrane protein